MSLFNLLPLDLQRLICFLFLSPKEIKKLEPKFYNNPQDVYWKEMVVTVTDERTPEGKTHRDFYEFFIYELFLEKRTWNKELLIKMIEDEIFLLRHINAQDVYGSTALMQAVIFYEEEKVKLLLAANANVNYCDNIGNTALMYAARQSSGECLKILLLTDVGINMQDNQGWTALMDACNYSCKENVKLLLEAGADFNLKNKIGRTALSYARTEDIKNLLTKS